MKEFFKFANDLFNLKCYGCKKYPFKKGRMWVFYEKADDIELTCKKCYKKLSKTKIPKYRYNKFIK